LRDRAARSIDTKSAEKREHHISDGARDDEVGGPSLGRRELPRDVDEGGHGWEVVDPRCGQCAGFEEVLDARVPCLLGILAPARRRRSRFSKPTSRCICSGHAPRSLPTWSTMRAGQS